MDALGESAEWTFRHDISASAKRMLHRSERRGTITQLIFVFLLIESNLKHSAELFGEPLNG